MTDSDANKLVCAMRDLDEVRVLDTVVGLAIDGEQSFAIFEKLCDGMALVDEKYEAGEYFIADLIMAGYIMRAVMSKVLSFQEFDGYREWGNVLTATVEGDIHELGKNVIIEVLRHNGFTVEDMGTDVLPRSIVRRLRSGGVDILILSGMLSASRGSMIKTVEAIKKAGLRDSVMILIGGNAVSKEDAEAVGADAVSGGVLDCLRQCQELMARRVLKGD